MLGVVVGLGLALVSSPARAQWTWDGSQWVNGAQTRASWGLHELSVTSGVSLKVGDKTFDQFTSPVVSGADDALGAGSDVAIRDSITVTGITLGGEFGLLFSSDSILVNDAYANAGSSLSISFDFVVTAPGVLINGASMVIPSGGATVGSPPVDEQLNIVENVYPIPPAGDGSPLAILNVAVPAINFGSGSVVDFDIGPFDPQNDVRVTKDLILFPGSADGGVLQLHQFAQTFKQVPEPGTLALAGLGLAMIAGGRRGRTAGERA